MLELVFDLFFAENIHFGEKNWDFFFFAFLIRSINNRISTRTTLEKIALVFENTRAIFAKLSSQIYDY